MANNRVSPSVDTVVRPHNALIGRKRKTVLSLSVTAGSGFRDVTSVFVPAGLPVWLTWAAVVGAVHYQVDLIRLASADFAESVEQSLTAISPALRWTPKRAGTYRIQVRSFNGTAWSEPSLSDDPNTSALNGAPRGWWIQAYLAPVSGGGIR